MLTSYTDVNFNKYSNVSFLTVVCTVFIASKNHIQVLNRSSKAGAALVKTIASVYVMYALDSAHVKVRRLNRSRSFGVLFDKPGRIERQVDPNTKLSNVIDSNVELSFAYAESNY